MSYKQAVLVTGGTNGLGYHATINIARALPDHLIVVASRSDRENSIPAINQTLGQTNTVFRRLDLADLASVREFAAAWTSESLPPIHYLLLNAGLQFPGEVTKTKDGIESTFAIAHVGHALLFHLLLPHLSHTARVVVTSSGTHDPAQRTGMPRAEYTSAAELANPSPAAARKPGRQRYTTAKLTNVMWTYALERRLRTLNAAEGMQRTVVAFDPGFMPGTGLARDAGAVGQFVFRHIFPRIMPLLRLLMGTNNVLKVEDSGANLAWVTLDPSAQSETGVYYEMRRKIPSSVESYDEKKQEDLWSWTTKEIVKIDELGQQQMA